MMLDNIGPEHINGLTKGHITAWPTDTMTTSAPRITANIVAPCLLAYGLRCWKSYSASANGYILHSGLRGVYRRLTASLLYAGMTDMGKPVITQCPLEAPHEQE